MLRHSLLIGAAVAAAMVTETAQATLLVYEGFDYVTTTPVGQSGGAGWGGNAWAVASGSSSYGISLQNQLVFSDYPVYGKTAEIFNNNNGGGAVVLARQLGVSVPAGTPFYTSFLVYQTKGYGNSSPASSYLGIGSTSTSGLKLTQTTRTQWGGDGVANVALGYGGTNGSANGILSDNTTYLVISKFTNTGDNTQVANMWVLNAADYDSAKVGGLTDARLDQYNRAKLSATSAGATISATDYLQVYDTVAWGYHNTMRVDEFRVMTSLADITATSVPEPAALGVLGLASLTLGRRRRM